MKFIECSEKHARESKSAEVRYRVPGGKSRVKLNGAAAKSAKPFGTQWYVAANSDANLVAAMLKLQKQIDDLETQLKVARDKLEQDAKAMESISLGDPPFRVEAKDTAATVSFVKKITVKKAADTKMLASLKILKRKPVEYELDRSMYKVIRDIVLGNYISQDLDSYIAATDLQLGTDLAGSKLPVKYEDLRTYLVKDKGLGEGNSSEIATEILLVRNYENIGAIASGYNQTAEEFIDMIERSFDVAVHTRVAFTKR